MGVGLAHTILVPVLATGADSTAQDLDMLPAGPAVELVQTQLLSAHIVPSPRLVFHVDAEVHVLLGHQHLSEEWEMVRPSQASGHTQNRPISQMRQLRLQGGARCPRQPS
jgi:hypothetical protein